MFRKRAQQASDSEEFEEFEEETVEEPGHAYTSRTVHQISVATFSYTTHLAEELREVFCPRCDSYLLTYDKATSGFVIVTCRKCKRQLGIQMKDAHRRVGFV